MTAYYNEFDPKAAAWIRELIKAGLIAPGVVDERSIEDVTPNDLAGFTQCHFFAGIGVWSYALRRAGWPDDRPVWTGSCPCQPFSAAGKGDGFADERHLWPAFNHLIEQCKPDVIFGEQVASKDADTWIDLVHTDMEAMGYAFGAVPFPSAGVGAPHIRDRLYWAADSNRSESRGRSGEACGAGEEIWIRPGVDVCDGLRDGGLADAAGCGRQQQSDAGPADIFDSEIATEEQMQQSGTNGSSVGRLGNPSSARLSQQFGERGTPQIQVRTNTRETIERAGSPDDACGRPGPTNGFWRDADWLGCRDGKWRPVEPSTFPLAHGDPARVGRLRGYGNAINAEAAKAFIESYLETKTA